MLLSGALFALFMTGFWLYCLTDAILTPAAGCRGLSKQAWIAVIAVTFIAGALAWLIVRRPVREPAMALMPVTDGSGWDEVWSDADDAAARHPAGRGMVTDRPAPKGPDDDPEFLSALGRAIRRNPPVS
jgi:peptidoglycan/LPS O-acetylase OafA/YrhL